MKINCGTKLNYIKISKVSDLKHTLMMQLKLTHLVVAVLAVLKCIAIYYEYNNVSYWYVGYLPWTITEKQFSFIEYYSQLLRLMPCHYIIVVHLASQ